VVVVIVIVIVIVIIVVIRYDCGGDGAREEERR